MNLKMKSTNLQGEEDPIPRATNCYIILHHCSVKNIHQKMNFERERLRTKEKELTFTTWSMRKEIQTANKMEVLFHLRLKHINSWNRHKIMVAYSNLQLAETMNQRNYWWCLSPTSAVFCSLGISGSYSTSINTANPPRTQNINPLSYFQHS